MEVFIIILTQVWDPRSQLYAQGWMLQVSKTPSFTHLGVQSLRYGADALLQDLRRGALKVLRSGLFEVSSNIEATTARTAYVI
jgi:hypothetical protein